jgi:hypothetical protein
METARWLLFESPTALAVALGLLLFGLLVHWRKTLNPRPLLVGLALAAILAVLQTVIVTPREHALQILDRVERDLLAGRSAALENALAADFQAGSMDRPAFLEVVRRKLRDVQIQKLERTTDARLAGDDRTYDAEFGYSGAVNSQDFAGNVPSRWRIVFSRGADGWQIQRIEPLNLALRPVTWSFYGGEP